MTQTAEAKHDLSDLARRARDGDQVAFREWLQATHGRVFRVALRTLGNTQAAEDVTQETFVRAWQGMARLTEPKASLGWVCRIARNVATDRLRKPVQREVLLGADDGGTPFMERVKSIAPGPEETLLSEENRVKVRTAIEALKPKHRTVLLLREVDDMSYDEIATVMGLPRGTVESRIHRARAKVKKALLRALKRETRSE